MQYIIKHFWINILGRRFTSNSYAFRDAGDQTL